MDNPIEQNTNNYHAAIREQASEWFLKLQNEPDNLDAKEAFSQWLTADETHEDAYIDVLMTWQSLDELNNDSELEQILASEDVSSQLDHSPATRVTHVRSSWRWGATILCSIVLLATLVPDHIWHNADYHTVAAEQRVLNLQDGSTLHLGPKSAVNVRFEADRRHIELLYGEAFFEVAKARHRPFSVAAESVQATALGTAFNMHILSDGVHTTLTEGRLQIDADKQPILQMTAGQRLLWQDASDYQLKSGQFDYWPSWKRQLLRVDRMPLGEVIRQLNRYYNAHFQLIDPRLSDRTLRGVLPLNDLDTAVLVLRTTLKVDVTRISDRLILLHKKN